MMLNCDGCRGTAGMSGCPTHGHSWSSSQPVITHCPHGLDLRLNPRCYLCEPITLAPTPPDALAAMRPIILDWMANTKWCIAHDMQPNGKCRDPEHYHGFEADDLLTAIAAGVTLDPRPAPDAALREAEQLAEAFTATWGWSPTHAWQQAQRVVAALKEKS